MKCTECNQECNVALRVHPGCTRPVHSKAISNTYVSASPVQ